MSYSNQQTLPSGNAHRAALQGVSPTPFLSLSRRLQPSESGANPAEVDCFEEPENQGDGLVAAVLKSADACYANNNLATAREFLALLNHGNRHTPKTAQALGNLHFLLGEHQEAADAYHVSLQLNPKSADTWVSLATALQRLGDELNMETCVVEALRLDPESQAALKLYADRKLGDKRFQEAALTYRKLIGEHPCQEEIFLSLAKCFFELGDRESCEAALQYVLEIAPDNALARDNLASLSIAAS